MSDTSGFERVAKCVEIADSIPSQRDFNSIHRATAGLGALYNKIRRKTEDISIEDNDYSNLTFSDGTLALDAVRNAQKYGDLLFFERYTLTNLIATGTFSQLVRVKDTYTSNSSDERQSFFAIKIMNAEHTLIGVQVSHTFLHNTRLPRTTRKTPLTTTSLHPLRSLPFISTCA